MDQMVNYIWLAWKLACKLRTTVGFSKYEFYNKLLGGVILFRVTLGSTWTQSYIYIYIYIYIMIYLYWLLIFYIELTYMA